MARLGQWAPAHQVFAAQLFNFFRLKSERAIWVSDVISEHPDGLFTSIFLDRERVAPFAWPTHIDRIVRRFPAFGPLALDSFRLGHVSGYGLMPNLS